MKKVEKKRKVYLSDLIGPTIAIENLLILLFYLWWNFAVIKKPGVVSYIIAYLLVFGAIFLIVLSIISFIRLLMNKEDLSKKLKVERTYFSVVGMILGLVLLLFTYTIACSITDFSKPVGYCDGLTDIVRENR